MVYPCIEVTVAKVGAKTVEDESTEDGKRYMTAFYNGATGIPGCSRGAWGRSDKYDDTAVHFLGNYTSVVSHFSSSWLGILPGKRVLTSFDMSDYDSRKEFDAHKALIQGPAPPVLDGLQYDTHVYTIHPNTNERTRVYYAPYTTVTFFWGIKEELWTSLAPELFAAVTRSDGSTGYIWGEIDKPVLSDPSGFSNLGSGKCGVLITGWRSKDQHDRDIIGSPRASAAWDAIQAACERTDDWGTSLTVTENTGHIHSWRTPLPLKDRLDWRPAAGMI